MDNNPHLSAYSIFVHNSPKLEATKRSLKGEWINKLLHIYTMNYSVRKSN